MDDFVYSLNGQAAFWISGDYWYPYPSSGTPAFWVSGKFICDNPPSGTPKYMRRRHGAAGSKAREKSAAADIADTVHSHRTSTRVHRGMSIVEHPAARPVFTSEAQELSSPAALIPVSRSYFTRLVRGKVTLPTS
jgi:hypothetical protein